MGLLKTALIAGGVLLGVGAVGGITAGVVTRQNSSASTVNSDSENTDSSFQTDGIEEASTLSAVLNSITVEDIVVKQDQQQKPTSDYYAFDLGKNTLEVKKEKTIPQEYKINLSIKQNQNDVTKLNNGELIVNVEVTKTGTGQKASKELEVNTFKKADMSLLALLEKDNSTNNPTNAYLLDLTPKMEHNSKFVSVSDLNNQDGTKLKELLTNSNKTGIENVTIEAKLKVSSITKKDEKPTTFTLSSSTQNGYLKLVKTIDGQLKTQALFKAIKTTNLLADEVSVNVVGINKELSQQYQKTLLEKTSETSSNGFKNTNDQLQVSVKKTTPMPESVSDVNLIASVFKSKEADGSIKIPLSLKVTFGKGDEATSFDTTNSEHAMMLQKAGFSFHIYTRYLANKDMKTAENLMASDIQDGDHDLSKYFVTNNYSVPIQKPETTMLMGQLNAISNGNFYVLGPFVNNLENNKELETKEWASSNKRNYLFFADYSYTAAGTKDMHALHEKVLFSPYLSLVNVVKDSQQQVQ